MLSSIAELQPVAESNTSLEDRRYMATHLKIYDMLIGNAVDLSAEWADMDEEERVIQRANVMSDWGRRHTLGELYRAGRLTPAETERLADLDRALLEQAPHIEIAYGPSLLQLIQNLMAWGTPLTAMDGHVRLDFPTKALPALAQALANSTK